MTVEGLDQFVSYCKRVQPQSPEDIARFFEGVIGFPYDKELLLQAYLYLNIQKFISELFRIAAF